jgi:hypothetical protein
MRFPSFLEVKLNGCVCGKKKGGGEVCFHSKNQTPNSERIKGGEKIFEVAEGLHKNVRTETW